MIKLIIFVIIHVIYSIAIFLCGRGYGNAENFDYIKNLKNENMMLKNDLSLKSVEDNKELQPITNSKMQNKNIKNTVVPPQRPKLNMIRETYSPLDALRNPNYKKY